MQRETVAVVIFPSVNHGPKSSFSKIINTEKWGFDGSKSAPILDKVLIINTF